MARAASAAVLSGLAAMCVMGGACFMLPSLRTSGSTHGGQVLSNVRAQGFASSSEASWGTASSMVILVGAAHAGLAAFSLRKSNMARKVKPDSGENQQEIRLFEQVFMDYTVEYLKGPLYWVREKEVGFGFAQDPDNIVFKNGKMTNFGLQYLKNWSSNELAFVSVLMFGLGLYGNLMWNIYDPQWSKVDEGGSFNAMYILEAFCLFPSFLLHLGCYIQKQNGK